jgi:hypothetical protein
VGDLMAIESDQYLNGDQRRAICISCGAEKFEPFHRCDACKFDPQNGDLVKSVYLSVYRYADDPHKALIYSHDLIVTQNSIRSGLPVIYEEQELQRLHAQIDEWVAAVPRGSWLINFLVILLLFALTGLAAGHFL